MILVELEPSHRAAFASFRDELLAAGEIGRVSDLATDDFDFDRHVVRLAADARGDNLPAGIVAQRTFWLVAGQEILGMTRLRLELTPTLLDHGGNIGYFIRPSMRRLGVGTRILALALGKARESGLDRVLITCAADNLGSRRIIERNGGELASESVSTAARVLVRRYWINLAPRPVT